ETKQDVIMPPHTEKRIPKRLGKEPLLEAVWELRFVGDPATGVALPGALWEKLRAGGRIANLEILPLATVPVEFRNAQEQLRHGATHALRGDGYTILTGDNVVVLSVLKPYPGWNDFKTRILELVGWISELGIIQNPQTFSIRYIDFFEGSPSETLKLLVANIQIGNRTPALGEFRLQMPVNIEGFQGLLQVLNPVQLANGVGLTETRGLVTDVLVAGEMASIPDAWDGFEARLEKAKAICHCLFFALLKSDTIESMDPVFEE
ncbi:hypothetical protein B2A_01325, partial [mine drainage metagenome]